MGGRGSDDDDDGSVVSSPPSPPCLPHRSFRRCYDGRRAKRRRRHRKGRGERRPFSFPFLLPLYLILASERFLGGEGWVGKVEGNVLLFLNGIHQKNRSEKGCWGEGWYSPKHSLLRQRPICNFRVRRVIGRRWVVEEGRRYWHEFRLNSNPDPSLPPSSYP